MAFPPSSFMKATAQRSSLFFTACLLIVVASVLAFPSMGQTEPRATVKTISGGVLNGKALSLPKPEYPEDARRSKSEGKVNVQILIDETGVVISAKAVSGTDQTSLRRSAEVAAMKATFSPTLLSGQPAKVSGVIMYNFVTKTNEEKLNTMGMAAFLETIRHFARDPNKVDGFFAKEGEGAEETFRDAAAEFPQLAAEFADLAKIESLTPEKRSDAITRAMASMPSKLDPAGRWQFTTGIELARAMVALMPAVGLGEEADPERIDEPSLKAALGKIRELLQSAPADIPAEVMAKLKYFAAAGTQDSLRTPEAVEDFVKRLVSLIETISPGATN